MFPPLVVRTLFLFDTKIFCLRFFFGGEGGRAYVLCRGSDFRAIQPRGPTRANTMKRLEIHVTKQKNDLLFFFNRLVFTVKEIKQNQNWVSTKMNALKISFSRICVCSPHHHLHVYPHWIKSKNFSRRSLSLSSSTMPKSLLYHVIKSSILLLGNHFNAS